MTFKHEPQTPPLLWVIIADRSRGRILSVSWPDLEGWQEIADLVHGEGRLKEGEVYTDRQGTFGEAAGRHHIGEPRTDFAHKTAEDFAAVLIEHLEEGRGHNKFGKLAIVCPPLFLGVLRENLPEPLARLVILEVDKDLTHASTQELTASIKEMLAK